MFKLQGVSVYWIAGTRVNISWAVPSLPPWTSILGYKLNWDIVWPSPIALRSVGAETSSVELDVDFTGVVYISVWAFSRGGDGPPVVLSESEERLLCVWCVCGHLCVCIRVYMYLQVCMCMRVCMHACVHLSVDLTCMHSVLTVHIQFMCTVFRCDVCNMCECHVTVM